jgi:hypothetical protein
MIKLLFVFMIIGIVAFILISMLTNKLTFTKRALIAFGIFMFLTLFVTIWLLIVGDKPLSGAITVYPEKTVEKYK